MAPPTGPITSAPTAAPPADANVAPETPGLLAVAKQLLPIAMFYGSGKVNWEDETNLNMLRASFYFFMFGCMTMIQLTKRKCHSTADKSRVANPGESSSFTKAEDGTVSAMQYDLAKVGEAQTQLMIGICVVLGIHFKWGYAQPLLVSGVMQAIQVFENKAVQAHVFGAEVVRPYAAAGGGGPLQQWAERKKREAEEEAEARNKKDD